MNCTFDEFRKNITIKQYTLTFFAQVTMDIDHRNHKVISNHHMGINHPRGMDMAHLPHKAMVLHPSKGGNHNNKVMEHPHNKEDNPNKVMEHLHNKEDNPNKVMEHLHNKEDNPNNRAMVHLHPKGDNLNKVMEHLHNKEDNRNKVMVRLHHKEDNHNSRVMEPLLHKGDSLNNRAMEPLPHKEDSLNNKVTVLNHLHNKGMVGTLNKVIQLLHLPLKVNHSSRISRNTHPLHLLHSEYNNTRYNTLIQCWIIVGPAP